MARTERPLDAEHGPVLKMAADLRRLREKAGSPSYRALSRQAHYSAGTLSEAASGRKLPSLPVTLAYVTACGGDTAEWEQRWHAISAELATEKLPGTGDGQAPYSGLATFETVDADRFFGRDELIAELCARVAGNRFVAVIGPSGSGKSSLLRAGLVHRMHTRGLHGLANEPTLVMTPGPHPLEECAAQLAAMVNGSASVLHTALRGDVGCLHLTGLQALVDQPERRELVVVVDQFEEIFTLCTDPDERAQFLRLLHTAATAPNSRTRIVLGVRADFYGHCAQYPELVHALRDAPVVVGPMTAEELHSAITRPAINVGCRVETALVSRVIADAGGEPGVLPLVSHALLETWRRRRGNTLSLAGYEAAGGIARAVAHTAESVYSGFTPAQQRWTRHLFMRLVTLGEGTEDTKRRLSGNELEPDSPESAAVLERLAQARLVTLDRDSVQITHETLIRYWPQLRGWLAEDREVLRLHHQLTDATKVWESLGHDPGSLYRGTRLALARDLVDAGDATLTTRERAFFDASVAAEATELSTARRRARRLRYLVALLGVLSTLTTAVTVHTVRADILITRERNVALSQKVAGDAVALRAENPALAAQLSLAAYRLVPTTEARNSLLSVVATRLTGHDQVIASVVFSSDGTLLVTGSYDRYVRLWGVSDRSRPTELTKFDTGHTDIVAGVALSPDGRVLATASRDRTTRLWNVTDPRHPMLIATLAGHSDLVFSAAFSPDGRTLATGSYDHTVRLWDIADPAAPKQLPVLTSHTLNVKPVVFSPDGKMLASGSDDRTVRLWNVADPRHPTELATLAGHGDFVDAVAFSPDGRTLASAGDDHTVRLWDIADPGHPTELAKLDSHRDIVTSVGFHPGGGTLASASNDHTVRLWNVADPRQPTEVATLVGHTGAVNMVTFSPDGGALATGSDDHTAELWDTDPHHVESRVCAVAIPTITRSEWEHYFPGLAYRPPCS